MEVIEYSLRSSQHTDALRLKWQDLFQRSGSTFFLSWYWISTWLDQLDSPPIVLEARDKGVVLGLGILCSCDNPTPLATGKRYLLHKTGNSKKDQVWIEHNDFLLDARAAASVRCAMIEHLAVNHPDMSALEISIGHPLDIAPPQRFVLESPLETVGYLKSLRPVYEDLNELLSTFSKNVRAQIRRSLRRYGNVILETAPNEKEALEWFHEAGVFHRKKWRASSEGSGFDNPCFVSFHEMLIRRAWPDRCVDLVRVRTNEQTLGYLYNFLMQGKVSFYLSGIGESEDNRDKPGLVTHVLAMQHYARLGYEWYDFLGGEARYKRSLSDQEYPLKSLLLHRKSWRLTLRNGLRALRDDWLKGSR